MGMNKTRTYSQCPECQATYAIGAGLARHRNTQHGVPPVVGGGRKVKAAPVSLAVRLAAIEAKAAAERAAYGA
jgi:hypothetical protein